MVEAAKPRVLITGISGYLGSQVGYKFLKSGQFTVRGTVRDTKNEKKIQPLKEGYGEELFQQLELVEADLLNEESIIEACKDCTYIVHTASPFPLAQPKNEDELIKPAVEGTLAALKGAQKYGIKRVVITSSTASIASQAPDFKIDSFDESVWSDLEASQPYPKSKTLAEKAAWDFIDNLPADQKIELATINPSFIIGPSFVKSDFSSAEAICKILGGKYPGVPRLMMPMVDVREVAQAHLEAILRPEAAGKRFILSAESLWFREMAQKLHNEFGQDYSIATRELYYWMVYLVSFVDAAAGTILPSWGREITINNQRSKEILGIEYRPTQESLSEFGHYLIDNGYLPDKRRNKK